MDYNPRRPFYLTLARSPWSHWATVAMYGGKCGRDTASPRWKCRARPVATRPLSPQLRPPRGRTFPTRRSASCAVQAPQAAVPASRAPQFRESLRYSRCVRGPQQASGVLPRGLRPCGPRIRVGFHRTRFAAAGEGLARSRSIPHAPPSIRWSNSVSGVPENDLAAAARYQRALAREPTNRDACSASRPSTCAAANSPRPKRVSQAARDRPRDSHARIAIANSDSGATAYTDVAMGSGLPRGDELLSLNS